MAVAILVSIYGIFCYVKEKHYSKTQNQALKVHLDSWKDMYSWKSIVGDSPDPSLATRYMKTQHNTTQHTDHC